MCTLQAAHLCHLPVDRLDSSQLCQIFAAAAPRAKAHHYQLMLRHPSDLSQIKTLYLHDGRDVQLIFHAQWHLPTPSSSSSNYTCFPSPSPTPTSWCQIPPIKLWPFLLEWINCQWKCPLLTWWAATVSTPPICAKSMASWGTNSTLPVWVPCMSKTSLEQCPCVKWKYLSKPRQSYSCKIIDIWYFHPYHIMILVYFTVGST